MVATRFPQGTLLCCDYQTGGLLPEVSLEALEKVLPAMAMTDSRRRYTAYLLRLWQVTNAEGTAWRASLESPRTHERIGFASLDDLVSFLRKETGEELEIESNNPAKME